MAEPPRKRRQVVAERRYSNPTQPSGKTPRGKPGRRAPVRRGNAVTRGVSGFIRLIWRAIFGTIWATALTVMGLEQGLAFAQARGLAARFVARQAAGRLDESMTDAFRARLAA